MEEFRSTEILDKEIQDDARRKAEKLLKRAEIDGQKILDDVKVRIENTAKEKQAMYAARTEALKNDLDAALPLEKERFLVSFIDSAIIQAIEQYISNLNDSKKIKLLEKLLVRYAPALSDKQFSVQFHGFKQDELEKLLKKHLGASGAGSFYALNDIAAAEQNVKFGMILESADRTVRCRVTINELVSELVDTNRFELAEALLGGRVVQ